MLPPKSVVSKSLSNVFYYRSRWGRVPRCAWILLLAASFFAPQANGQSAHIAFRGRVLDRTGAAIRNARATAIALDDNAGPSVVSDGLGVFVLLLEPGRYTLHIAAPGFLPFVQNIEARDESKQVSDFTLAVAGTNSTVTVTATPDYHMDATSSSTRTLTSVLDIPQSITFVSQQQIKDQMMVSVADVVQYVPGITAHQGENNRDQLVIRGNSTSADFFLDGVRDDVQYYRDLYNLERVEALKGPNAMIFGRGGGGGVVNRVTKEAQFTPLREVTFLGGSFGERRLTGDFDQPLSRRIALRFNGMYEGSDSFRKYVDRSRFGVNPTLTFAATPNTTFRFAYEFLHDRRVADRGIPSFHGLPLDTDIATYFGNPEDSHVRADVHLGSFLVSHQAGSWSIQNRTLIGDYDRGYQNYVPGAVDATGTRDSLSAYNNATQRRNMFNQTTVSTTVSTGRIRQIWMGGVEFGRQLTDNFRNTGFFNNTATTVLVDLVNPVIDTPVTFRQSPTDANNHLTTNLAAAFVQDQVWLTSRLQVVGGLRFDYFDLQYHNNRNGDDLRRIDNLVSPRAGVVYKLFAPLSLYSSYTVSYLPSSGDQFSSLTNVTEQVKPERFNNYEFGLKWDIRRDLGVTAAVYRLDRTNTRSTDPNDPTRIVQTGRTRNDGFEVGWNGRVVRSWQIAGGYAYQDSSIAATTSSAPAGKQVAMVPHHTFSLWNKYQVVRRVGAGLGVIHRSDMFAAIDNSVLLPKYTRADAALFVTLTERVDLQANVENLLGATYYLNADGNNNISPGSSRSLRLALRARF